MTFQDELRQLINRHSIENGSNTPDFILAEYLNRCLSNFATTTRDRENYYRIGKMLVPHQGDAPTKPIEDK